MHKALLLSAIATILFALSPVATAAGPVIVVISHEVTDFAEWKKRFEAGKDHRDKAGLTQRYVMRDVDKPNVVIVVLEGSLENVKKFVSDPGFKDRIKKASSTGTAEIKIGIP
jgi:hypothetical protein